MRTETHKVCILPSAWLMLFQCRALPHHHCWRLTGQGVKMKGSGKDRTLNHRENKADFEGLDTWLTQAKLAQLALFHPEQWRHKYYKKNTKWETRAFLCDCGIQEQVEGTAESRLGQQSTKAASCWESEHHVVFVAFRDRVNKKKTTVHGRILVIKWNPKYKRIKRWMRGKRHHTVRMKQQWRMRKWMEGGRAGGRKGAQRGKKIISYSDRGKPNT